MRQMGCGLLLGAPCQFCAVSFGFREPLASLETAAACHGAARRSRPMPYARRAGPFTREEDEIICQSHARLGNRWIEIAKLLPGRSDNAVKNRWNSFLMPTLHRLGVRPEFKPRSRKKAAPKASGAPMSSVCFRRLDECVFNTGAKAEFPAQVTTNPAFEKPAACPTMPRSPQWTTLGMQPSQWTVAYVAPTGLGCSDPYTLLCQMRQNEIVHAQMRALLMHQLTRHAAFTPLSSHIPVAIPVPASDPMTRAKPAGKRGDL